MNRPLLLLVMIISFFNCTAQQKKFVLVIHGGAGTILKSQMTAEKEKLYTQGLDDALQAGNEVLSKGGTALDAVTAAIKILEDNPLFNAGKGAVFTNEGKNEMDAAIMDGKNLKAGSVASVTTIKNPITAARAVMEKSEHVMMVGKGAEKFAQQSGCTIVDPSYFFTQDRWNSLQKVKAEDSTKAMLDHDSSNALLKQPGNYDYNVMERGATLSLGQRQLLSFIRALLYNPAILILDEATSSVDTESEQLIQHAIDTLINGRTAIVIAHRLSTIRGADQILVLEEGRIVQRGTHEQLLAAGGLYADLYHRQFETKDVTP